VKVVLPVQIRSEDSSGNRSWQGDPHRQPRSIQARGPADAGRHSPTRRHRLLPGMFVYVTFKIAPSGTHCGYRHRGHLRRARHRVAIVGAENTLRFQRWCSVATSDLDRRPGWLQGHETIVKQPTVPPEGQRVTPVESRARPGANPRMRSGRGSTVPRRSCALWAVCIMTGGCMVGPNYARPAVEQPAHFKIASGQLEAAPDIAREWWQLYGDPELDRLIATATASNQTLRQAWRASTRPARSLASRPSFSSSRPSPPIRASHTSGTLWNRESTVTGRKVAQGVTVNDWLIPFDLTLRARRLGRVRRSFESARAPGRGDRR